MAGIKSESVAGLRRNSQLVGLFRLRQLAKAYRDVDHYVVDHVRAFHVRRNKMQNRGTESFSRSSIYGELKVVALWKHHPNPTPIALP